MYYIGMSSETHTKQLTRKRCRKINGGKKERAASEKKKEFTNPFLKRLSLNLRMIPRGKSSGDVLEGKLSQDI